MTAAQQKDHGTLSARLQDYRDMIRALSENAAQFNDSSVDLYVLREIETLAEQIPILARLLDEASEDQSEEGATAATKLQEAKACNRICQKAAVDLITTFGQEPIAAHIKVFKQERAKKAVEAQKLAEKEAVAAAKAAAEAEKLAKELKRQQDITATGVAERNTGTVFDRPPAGKARDDLLTYLQLKYPEFSSLTGTEIANPALCFYHLTQQQLGDLIQLLAGKKVQQWAYQGAPATRTRINGQGGLVMPVKIQSLDAKIGAEIFHDWVIPNAGHTASVDRIISSFDITKDHNLPKFTQFGGTVDVTPTRLAFRYNTGRRLVTTADRDLIITYYDGN